MAKFIEVTTTCGEGFKALINVHYILGIFAHESGSVIRIFEGDEDTVKETPKEILKLIKEA